MIFFYQFLSLLLFPILVLIIFIRIFFGKEDKERYKEKFSIKIDNNFNLAKNKKVIWFHAASIGEVNSIFPFIKNILEEKNDIFILLTSTSLSSSQLIKNKMKFKNFKHRFFLLDIGFLIKEFLDYWNPQLVVFVDSEVWPTHMLEIKKRNIPLVLLNGRITNKTFKKWSIIPKTSKIIFKLYDLCLASSLESQNNLKNLGARNVKFLGNIKFCTDIKNENNINPKVQSIKNKKIWSAASTHPGEEIFFLKTHLELKKIYNNVLTLIIPRHIERSNKIFSECKNLNLNIEILENISDVKEDTEVIVIKSFGNMIDIFNYSKSVFMGKSLIESLKEVGGQNPIEPAKCGCKIYHGPYVANFKDIYNFLNDKNIAFKINNEIDLSQSLIKDFEKEKTFNEKRILELDAYGKEIFSITKKELFKSIQ